MFCSLLFQFLLAGSIFGAQRVWACPSPQTLGSDISIVLHNDLYGNQSWRNGSALVLSSPVTRSQAQEACQSLGETLFGAGQDGFLSFVQYQGQGGLYWVNHGCKTITNNGLEEFNGTCPDHLPTLCSQSAPISDATTSDNSTKWWTEVPVGEDNWLIGFRDKYSFRFQGVRYAPQPKRFDYSTPYVAPKNNSALDFQSSCVESGGVGSEDCLFLNIWTPYLPSDPDEQKSKLKPVMFWIHGGAFKSGSGSDAYYGGGGLSSRGDVVVVTINYRLSTLGFLALDDGVTNGNYGLADQITALDWVRDHISSFGGDPARITIFGQSAGAASVRALTASPKAIGKFAAAIPQSNLAGGKSATTYSKYYSIAEESSLVSQPILNATGCLNVSSAVDCLRGVDPYLIANISTDARYLVVDGTFLISDGLNLTGHGPAAHVPVMMGFMRDDGAAFNSYPKGNESFSAYLTRHGFNYSTATTDLFPIPQGKNASLNVYNASSLLYTDLEFRCLDEATAYSAIKNDVYESVYFYQFNRSYQTAPNFDPNYPVCDAPVQEGFPNGNPSAEYFKCHSGELYYVFGSLMFNNKPLRDENDIPMSQFTLDTWASFARTYDPNIDQRFLAARGFSNTTAAARQAGRWSPVENGRTLRLMQYPSLQAAFEIYSSADQCVALGYPLDYFESQ